MEKLTHRSDLGRFELEVGDELVGHVEYVAVDDAMAITTVQVRPRHSGQGYGGRLADAALQEARAQGRPVLPYCSFVQEHVRRNPQYLDLVPEAARRRFGLAA